MIFKCSQNTRYTRCSAHLHNADLRGPITLLKTMFTVPSSLQSVNRPHVNILLKFHYGSWVVTWSNAYRKLIVEVISVSLEMHWTTRMKTQCAKFRFDWTYDSQEMFISVFLGRLITRRPTLLISCWQWYLLTDYQQPKENLHPDVEMLASVDLLAQLHRKNINRSKCFFSSFGTAFDHLSSVELWVIVG